MEEVTLRLDANKHGHFLLTVDDKAAGEMEVSIQDNLLTAHHTEVYKDFEGRGYAKLMLQAMVAYATSHGLSVVPQCEYVKAQFNRNPEKYSAVWKPGH